MENFNGTTPSIAEKIQALEADFTRFQNWEDRYRHLIQLGKSLPPMEEQYRVETNKVRGCQSQVWLHPELKGERLFFQADSDASIVKGIIALLLQVYSGSTLDEILQTRPQFLETIGLREHLSMSRANGLSAMLKQITLYAMAFKAKQQMESPKD